jgi:hypothetical protein
MMMMNGWVYIDEDYFCDVYHNPLQKNRAFKEILTLPGWMELHLNSI